MVPAEWYCELTWPVRPSPEPRDGADGSWLLIGDAFLGAEIGRLLGVDASVAVLAPAVTAEDPAAVADALAGVTHVLYAPDGTGSFDRDLGYGLFDAARKLAATAADRALPPKLFMLTRNAQPVSAGDRANPAHAVLWGLGRTLALEHPEIWGGIIDVDESVPAELAARWVLAEAHNGDGEDQVVYRAGMRRVPRMQRAHRPGIRTEALDPDSSHLVIGATGNIGPQLIEQLADMGAATIVAVSRNPGSRLDELAHSLSERGTTLMTAAADASDEASLSSCSTASGQIFPLSAASILPPSGAGR